MLVRIIRSTISSGTERANIVGDKNISFLESGETAVFPRRLGYSSAGIVEKTGPDVKNFAVGDRVALSWTIHGKYFMMEENSGNIHKIPYDEISYGEAALAHIATFPMAAIRKCHLEMGEAAMVVGLGVLGLIAVQLLRAAGAYPVIAVDLQEEKCRQALHYGADYAFSAGDPELASRVKKVCNGVNVAIEVTGNGKALDMTLDCMAKFGRVALLGCTRQSDFTIDYYRKVHGPGVSLIGAHTLARPEKESSAGLWTTHDDAMTVLKLAHGRRIDLASLIEEVHSPLEAEAVYNRLCESPCFQVVQFDWENFE